MICADVAYVLHTPVTDLKRERWSSLIEWHKQAVRIAKSRAML